ncbi:ATP-dependent RNA helicase dbp6 [Coelomomyces lativittatus]|nr:ATP-dependent RNA helicase dbp6 [Coelomomyces lativittatus]KAJ1516019.1 ATP-dependent RNA helicase dbp6 [Coelomomyces lativittatus]
MMDFSLPDLEVDVEKNEKEQHLLRKRLKFAALPDWLAHPTLISSSLLETQKTKEDHPQHDFSAFDVSNLGITHTALQQNCLEMGLTHWFPVQETVIPLVLKASSSFASASQQRDVLVSAPTGSGKTLAYVLPILQRLSERKVKRLRALVIVPTRELVAQVTQVFRHYAKGTSLVVGHMAGNASAFHWDAHPKEKKNLKPTSSHVPSDTLSSVDFVSKENLDPSFLEKEHVNESLEEEVEESPSEISIEEEIHASDMDMQLEDEDQDTMVQEEEEEEEIVGESDQQKLEEKKENKTSLPVPSSFSFHRTLKEEQAYFELPDQPSTFLHNLVNHTVPKNHAPKLHAMLSPPQLLEGHSNIDILVSTPLRLLDHLYSTPNFTLQHLKYLVLDEADRLLEGAAGDWLTPLLEAMGPPRFPIRSTTQGSLATLTPFLPQVLGFPHRPCVAGPRKWLFSATLTRNPEKLGLLHLHCPLHIATATHQGNFVSKYSVPTTLHERVMLMPTLFDKPLALMALVSSPWLYMRKTLSPSTPAFIPSTEPLRHPQCLIFTRTTEAAHRLTQLLKSLLSPSHPTLVQKCACFAGDLPQRERDHLLTQFQHQDLSILITSDVMARGIDVHVDWVINYDHPNFYSQYIHRIGRTARAGKPGTGISLLGYQEFKFFKDMIKKKRDTWNIDTMKYKASKAEKYQLKCLLDTFD